MKKSRPVAKGHGMKKSFMAKGYGKKKKAQSRRHRKMKGGNFQEQARHDMRVFNDFLTGKRK